MWEKLLPVICALIGALVGGIVGETRIALQTSRERKRTLKKVLFNQLELWYETRRRRIGRLIETLERCMESRIASSDDLESTNIREALHEDGLGIFFKEALEMVNIEEMVDRYQNTIGELAPCDPVLAYQLSGRVAILEYQRWYGDILQQIEISNDSIEDVEMTAMVEYVQDYVDESASQKVTEALEEDVKMVASAISFREWWRVWRLIRGKERLEEKQNMEMEQELNRYFDDFIARFKKTQASKEY